LRSHWSKPPAALVSLSGMCSKISRPLLALTYMDTVEEGQCSQACRSSQPLGYPRRRGRNARQVAKKFSFFKAHRIGAVLGGSGRPADWEKGQRWPLGQRTEVLNHCCLQPHGPHESFRCLQWVLPHMRGPRAGILSTNLIQLEAANEPEIPNQVAQPNGRIPPSCSGNGVAACTKVTCSLDRKLFPIQVCLRVLKRIKRLWPRQSCSCLRTHPSARPDGRPCVRNAGTPAHGRRDRHSDLRFRGGPIPVGI